MNNFKVLITGASGFIGSSLVKKTSMSGFDVMAMSRTCPETKVVGKIHWLRADLSSPETYKVLRLLFSAMFSNKVDFPIPAVLPHTSAFLFLKSIFMLSFTF